jgi:hypothetical protein
MSPAASFGPACGRRASTVKASALLAFCRSSAIASVRLGQLRATDSSSCGSDDVLVGRAAGAGKAGSTAIDNSVPTGTCKAPCRMIAPSGE